MLSFKQVQEVKRVANMLNIDLIWDKNGEIDEVMARGILAGLAFGKAAEEDDSLWDEAGRILKNKNSKVKLGVKRK